MIFISPGVYSQTELNEIKNYEKTDPEYVKGVTEGWSILVTAKDIDNVIIMPGMREREELVSQLSREFWTEYSEQLFAFTDGTVMTKPS